jgi:ATP-dependent Lon protease
MSEVDSIIDLKKNTPGSGKDEPQDFIFEELNSLSERIEQASGLPDELHKQLAQMLDRLNRMAKLGHYAQEFDILARYIKVITSIPWDKRTKDTLDLKEAKVVLDKNHYGMEDVKERMLEYLAMMRLIQDRGGNAMAKTPILLLVGLQGVGKTTLASSIAEALDRKFIRIALGAIGSVLELRGRSKVFPEAEPGQIIKAFIKTGVRNPVILLDEIEKASGEQGLRSDVMATLLEILDPNQNTEFRDHYIDHPMDLSEVLFICSANNTGTISAALMDRMEVIKMPAYTDQEKIVIARDYLMPQIFANTGLEKGELEIDPELWPSIVRPFGYDTGIRSLGRTLEAICRKVAKEIVEGKSSQVFINESNLKHYLPK